MRQLVMFLNELSYEPARGVPADQILPIVLSTVHAARTIKSLRSDVLLAGMPSIAKVSIGADEHSLATILRGDIHKDTWRFLVGLQQSSPWDACPNSYWPHDMEEVRCNGRPGHGLLWAKKTDSFVLSVGFEPEWSQDQIAAEHDEIVGDNPCVTTAVIIRNVSNPTHVHGFTDLIINYGLVLSPSSLVKEADTFSVRMFFNDHDPPHFHVMFAEDPSKTMARVRIDNLDVLSGQMPANIRKGVFDWARENRAELQRDWERCRRGEHPVKL
jgi:hypothetical protein